MRVMAGALAAVTLAGPVAGYAIGHSQRPGRHDVVVGDTAASSPSDVVTTTTGSANAAIAPASTAVPFGGPIGISSKASAAGIATSSSEGYPGAPVMEKIAAFDSGRYRVRLFSQTWPTTPYGLDGPYDAVPPNQPAWQPPAFCNPIGQLLVEVSDADMVAQTGGSLWAELRNGPITSFQLAGVAEGAPAWVVSGQVDKAVTSVTVGFPGGVSQTAQVTNGLFAAVAEAPGADYQTPPGDFTLDTGSGPGPLGTQYPYNTKECQPPPPPLPAPGVQPADADAARAAVTKSMHAWIDKKEDGVARNNVLEDLTGIDDLEKQLADSGFAAQVKAARITVGDIVFTDATHAAVRYDIDAVGLVFANRTALLHLVDGTWKISRRTFCDAIALAGVQCPEDIGVPGPVTTGIYAATTVPPSTATPRPAGG